MHIGRMFCTTYVIQGHTCFILIASISGQALFQLFQGSLSVSVKVFIAGTTTFSSFCWRSFKLVTVRSKTVTQHIKVHIKMSRKNLNHNGRMFVNFQKTQNYLIPKSFQKSTFKNLKFMYEQFLQKQVKV